jgi:hypothetical protein
MLVGAFALWPVRSFAADRILRGVGFDERLSGDVVLAEALRLFQFSLNDMPLNMRLVLERAEVERQPGVYNFDALDARMARYSRLEGVQIYIDLRDTAPSPDTLDAWGRFVRAIATRYRGVVRGYVFGVRTSEAVSPLPREHAFFVKTTAVNLRAGDDGAATIMGGVRDRDAAWLVSVYLEDVAPYVDAIGLEGASTNAAILALIDQYDPSSGVVLLGESLGEDPAVGARRFLERHLGVLGTRISGVTYAAATPVVAAALAPIASLRGMLGQELVALDEKALGLRLTRAGEDVTTEVRHQLLFGLRNATNYFIYSDSHAEPKERLELVLSEPTGTRPTIEDALGNARLPARSFSYDSSTRTARMELPGGPRTLVVDWSTSDGTTYSAREDVSSTVLPSVAEIISRHQQAQAAQDGLIRSYVAHANMEQHFRTTAIDSGFDVMTENRFFVEGKNTEWEELSFRLNGTKWGPKRPAFPLLQAEKVLSLPLDLRLNTDYRYRLVGVEDVDGRPSFTLRFDPIEEQRTLYRGTVWIDRETYVKVKAQSIQTRLSSPVVSSEEIQYFSPVGTVAGHDIHLLTRLVGRQIMLIAGRNLVVERGVRFDAFQLNPTDFEAQREAARASDRVMYRDTDEGLRYLVNRDGVRVVQTATTRATAGLMGITYDPSYDYPLPLAGINYLDFNFLGKDNQLAVVFGGVLALVNLQRPKLLGQHVDGSVDLFAIAVKGNDRTYDGTGELTGQRLATRPFSTGVNLGWQMAEFQKLVGSYQFRFDAFSVDEATATTFRPPASTVTHGVGLSWEWKQGGYSVVAGATSYRRARWEPWGDPGDYRPTDQSYLKYSASLSKDYFFGFQKVHLNTAYYGGRDLDRFSAYQFGFFDDNRVHGVPSAGMRFGELGMFRGSYSFNLLDQYRLDLFLDQAFGRDPRLETGWQAVTGIGIGGNIRGPMNTLLRGDVGKSFLPSQYRRPGSLVVQVQILKPL